MENLPEEGEEVTHLLRLRHHRECLYDYLFKMADGLLCLMDVTTILSQARLSLLPQEDKDPLNLVDALFLKCVRKLEREVAGVNVVEHSRLELTDSDLDHLNCFLPEVLPCFWGDQQVLLRYPNKLNQAVEDQLQEVFLVGDVRVHHTVGVVMVGITDHQGLQGGRVG